MSGMTRDKIRELKEKRARIWSESKEVLDRVAEADNNWSADDETKWEQLEKDLSDLDLTIDRAEATLEADRRDADYVDQRDDESGAAEGEYDEVFRKYLSHGTTRMSDHDRNILAGQRVDARALGEGVGAAGGYTVPPGFWNRISENMLAFGNVASVANVIRTATGNDLPWLTNDDTTNEGSILAENTQILEQDVTFGTRSLGAFTYTSKLVRVSLQLLQDSEIDVEGFLARKFAMRLARIHNRHQTGGTGAAQPQGVVTGATNGVTAAGATDVTYDEIVDLIHSVDPAYRIPGSQFMFNDGTLGYLRKIRDDSGGSGLGRPLWEPSIQVGEPSSILGYGYVVNQHMDGMTTGNKSILFGDFRTGYVVREVKDSSLVRLAERYAEYLQVGFFAFNRMDAVVDDAAAYKALTQA